MGVSAQAAYGATKIRNKGQKMKKFATFLIATFLITACDHTSGTELQEVSIYQEDDAIVLVSESDEVAVASQVHTEQSLELEGVGEAARAGGTCYCKECICDAFTHTCECYECVGSSCPKEKNK